MRIDTENFRMFTRSISIQIELTTTTLIEMGYKELTQATISRRDCEYGEIHDNRVVWFGRYPEPGYLNLCYLCLELKIGWLRTAKLWSALKHHQPWLRLDE